MKYCRKEIFILSWDTLRLLPLYVSTSQQCKTERSPPLICMYAAAAVFTIPPVYMYAAAAVYNALQ